jgi:hypothetical protein
MLLGGLIMNLVDAIKGQLSNEAMRALGSLIGAGEGPTRSAVGAAVPALLSEISSLASNSAGAQKLVSALGNYDTDSLGDLGRMLGQKPGSVLEEGNELLKSLLSGGSVSKITNALSRYTGIGQAGVQKLLGYLMPLVLGGVAGRFADKELNPQSLTGMLGEQKNQIASALPSGFSLADVPQRPDPAGSAVRAGAVETRQPVSSLLRWLVPVGALAALALVIWAFMRPTSPSSPTLAVPKAAVPNVASLTTDITDDFKDLTQSLNSVTNAATASAALPKLEDLSGKLDGMKVALDKLPDADRAQITQLIKADIGKVDDQFAKLLWTPNVGEKIRPVVDDVMKKFASLGGMPVPQTAIVSEALASAVSSMSEVMTGIKDAASAETALPKLKAIDEKLDVSKNMMASLSEAGRSTISSLVRTAIAKLKEVADRVVAIAGAGDKVKPVVTSIMNKLTALAG